MIDYLVKIFGVRGDGFAKVVSVGLEWRNAHWLSAVLIAALLLGVLTWWTYRDAGDDAPLAPGRRRILIGLRTALLVMILLTLLRPVLAFHMEGKIRRTLVALFDTSGSMAIADPRIDPVDIKRAQLFCKTGDPKHVARIDLVKDVLHDEKLHLLTDLKKEFDLSAFQFGQNLERIDAPSGKWADVLRAQSPMTEIGDAVSAVLNQKRGQPLAGLLLVTDGANNGGMDAIEGARLAKEQGVPLIIYGVGITSPRDINVGTMLTQEVAFVNDDLPVSVRVRAQGLRGEKAHLSLKLADETVADQEIEFKDDSEQVVQLHFTPKKAGEFTLEASIPPRNDEAVKDNNQVSQRLRVVDSKIKVLYIEQTPRWEFRYLQGILLRDRRVDFKCVLLDGDPDLANEENSPYLPRLPETKEEWLKYDLVILGDVDPKAFAPEQLGYLDEFVSKFGGSIISIAGKHFNPNAYSGTKLGSLLPVEVDTSVPEQGEVAVTSRQIHLALTAAGRSEPMLRLAESDPENVAAWKGLPPVEWDATVTRAKPGAQVLLEDPDPDKASRFGKMPVMAFEQYGLGQVLYIGTDNTWRWRKNAGEKYYSAVWGRIVQRMALAHLLGGAKRTQLTVDKQNYVAGERVTVYARLYSETYEPVKEAVLSGTYRILAGASAEASEVQPAPLRAVPGQQGVYRTEFVAAKPGSYQYFVANDPNTVVEFSVAPPRFEFGDTAMNEAGLREMADISGGAFYREEDLGNLAKKLKEESQLVKSQTEAELWCTPFYFMLMLTTATAEWILRKRWGLK